MKGYFNQTINIELDANEDEYNISEGTGCTINGLVKEDCYRDKVGASVTIEEGIDGLSEPTTIIVFSGAIESDDKGYNEALDLFGKSDKKMLFLE